MHQARDAKTVLNDLTRSLYQSPPSASTSEPDPFADMADVPLIDLHSTEVDLEQEEKVDEEEDSVGVWAKLIGLVKHLKTSASDCAAYIARTTGGIMGMFASIYRAVKKMLTVGKFINKAASLVDWKLVARIFILLALYVIGITFDCLGIISIIGIIYTAWAFEATAYYAVPTMLAGMYLVGEVDVHRRQVRYQDDANGLPQIVLGVTSLLGAASLGKFTFFQEPKVFDDFIVRLDRQSRAWGAITSLTDRIGSLLSKAMGWIGLSEYGFSEDLTRAMPEDVEKYVEEVKYFSNGNILTGMSANQKDCLRALALFESLTALQYKYRGTKPILDTVNRYAGYVYRVFNHANISNPHYQKPRDETVVLFLQGKAGVGKTKLVYLLSVEALKVKHKINADMTSRELEDAIGSEVYSRSAQQEFWDGYHGQLVTVVDDFGQLKDSATNPNIEYDELIRISNSFPYALHMARLEEKASSFFKSCLYIATTNLTALTPPSLVCHEAIHRRIRFSYNVQIKADCVTPSGKIKPEIAQGPLRKDIYEFRYWDPATGLVSGDPMSFEEVRDALRKELKLREHKGKSEMNSCIDYAREILAQSPEDEKLAVEVAMAEQKAKMEKTRAKAKYVARVKADYERAEAFEKATRPPPASEVPLPEDAFQVKPDEDTDYHVTAIRNMSIKNAIAYLSSQVLPRRIGHYINRAFHKYDPLEDMSLDVKAHAQDIKETNTFWNKTKNLFKKMWALCTIKNLLGILAVVGIGYVGTKAIIERRRYNKNKVADFPSTDMDREMWKTGIYRAETGEDGGSFKYRQYWPAWYGQQKVYDTEALDDEDVEFEDEDVGKMPTKKWLREFGVKEENIEEMYEEYAEFKKFKQAYQSGKSKGVHPKRSRAPAAPKSKVVKAQAWGNSNAEQIGDVVSRNMRTMNLLGYEKHVFVMLKERRFIMNHHSMAAIQAASDLSGQGTVEVKFLGAIEGTELSLHSITWEKVTYKGEAYDLIIGTLPKYGIPCAKDITPHLVRESDLTQLLGKTAVLTVPGSSCMMQKVATIRGLTTQESLHESTGIRTISKMVEMRGRTVAGDCGGLYTLDSRDARRLFGLHAAGVNGAGISYAVPIFAELFEDDVPVYQDPVPVVKTNPMVYGHEMGEFLQQGAGNVLPLETISRIPFANTKSKIVKTEIFGEIFETQVAPAKLAEPLHPQGPMITAVEKQFGPVKKLDEIPLMKARRDYIEMLDRIGVPEVMRVLTFEEATQGIPGTDYFKPINRSRSAGYPWSQWTRTKGKTQWFGHDEWEYNDHTAALENTIREQIAQMEKGQLVDYIFTDTLKDETRPIEKVQAGKTRVFAAAPMDFLIVFRQYFLCFIVHMMKNRIVNESAVGIRAQSREWTQLYHKLQTKGNRVIAGDFSNYDGSLNPEILWVVYDIIEEYYVGSTPEERRVRRFLWEALVNSKHLMGCIIYQLNHSQPSGNPSTAVLNTMYNSLACRYVFFKTYDIDNEACFSDYVSMIAYGDDNVLNVSSQVPDFSQAQMAHEFAKIGMIYTDETKSGSLRDKTIAEVAFLKRKFAYDPAMATCYCPLALPSILECFNWIKKTDQEGEIMRQLATSAYVELSMHEEDVFDEYTQKIRLALGRGYGCAPTRYRYHEYRGMMITGELITRFPDLEWA